MTSIVGSIRCAPCAGVCRFIPVAFMPGRRNHTASGFWKTKGRPLLFARYGKTVVRYMATAKSMMICWIWERVAVRTVLPDWSAMQAYAPGSVTRSVPANMAANRLSTIPGAIQLSDFKTYLSGWQTDLLNGCCEGVKHSSASSDRPDANCRRKPDHA